jgi:pimeloyl-ACP methyl ester carboxylesterase
MMQTKTFARVRDLDICFDLADFTDPWRNDKPETLLLYSGYCRTMAFWRAWVPLLGRRYRILRLDPRGYGDTRAPAGQTITPSLLVGDAMGLMEELGIRRVHWVGEVTGGTLGLMAALEHPQRIASITLCNAYAKMGDETPRNYALGEESQEAAVQKYGVAEWCRRTLPYRMDLKRAAPQMAGWMADEMAKTPVPTAIAAFKFFSGVDLTPRLGEITAPVLMIVGKLCAPRLKQHAAMMRDTLPRAEIVEIEGYDYGVHCLAPEAVTAAVQTFLAQIS